MPTIARRLIDAEKRGRDRARLESRLWLVLILLTLAWGQWHLGSITYGNRQVGYTNQRLLRENNALLHKIVLHQEGRKP